MAHTLTPKIWVIWFQYFEGIGDGEIARLCATKDAADQWVARNPLGPGDVGLYVIYPETVEY